MIFDLVEFITESTLALILVTLIMYFIFKGVLIDCLVNRQNKNYFKKLTKKHWKYIDYIWLIIALVGVALGNKEAFIKEMTQEAELSKTNAILHLTSLRDFAGMHYGSACIDPTGKFDAIEGNFELETNGPSIEYELACNWIQAVESTARRLNINQLDEVKLYDFPEVPRTIASYEAELELKKTLGLYRMQRKRYYESKQKIIVSRWEEFLFKIAPLLICVAVALRMVKTTGEIKLE